MSKEYFNRRYTNIRYNVLIIKYKIEENTSFQRHQHVEHLVHLRQSHQRARQQRQQKQHQLNQFQLLLFDRNIDYL